jgi:hypothetical protein
MGLASHVIPNCAQATVPTRLLKSPSKINSQRIFVVVLLHVCRLGSRIKLPVYSSSKVAYLTLRISSTNSSLIVRVDVFTAVSMKMASSGMLRRVTLVRTDVSESCVGC